MTVEAGSVLFTGSPSGSAAEHGNRWLQPGDRIHAEIENVGALDVTLYARASKHVPKLRPKSPSNSQPFATGKKALATLG